LLLNGRSAIHLTLCPLLHYFGKENQALKCAKNVKNISNIIDRSLKRDHQISIIFGTRISDTTG